MLYRQYFSTAFLLTKKRNWQIFLLVPVFFGFLCFIGCGDKRNWSHAHRSTLIKEIKYLQKKGVDPNLKVSDRAHVILPYHIEMDIALTKPNLWRLLKQFQNQKLEFVSLDFEQEPIPYEGFRLLRGTILSVKDDRGQVLRLDILGSVIEKSGEYKLLSYKD